MKFTNTEVFNLKNAIRGMRNSHESYDKADSYMDYDAWHIPVFKIGKNDLDLAQTLVLAGDSHAKYMRQIFVSVDITAPLLWWKEMDQYRIGVTTNSESTMYRLSQTKITTDCFERNEITEDDSYFFNFINHLENLRKEYNETKDKEIWLSLIQELPESWLQMRTTTMSYANLRNIYFQRRNHKLSIWSIDFVNWIKTLPYSKELIMLEAK